MVHTREVFRYKKANRTRVYGLKPLSDERSELWVVAEQLGKVTASRKLLTFDNQDSVDAVLEDVQRELRAGGWSALYYG